jgi:pyruvate-ferredoxin/flavodoxin oxidoreductase
LLAGPRPVKVLLLAGLDLGLAAPPALDSPLAPLPDPNAELGLAMLANRGALVAQTSVGDLAHLGACLARALDHPGPALLLVHTPAPRRDGFAPDQTLVRAREAVAARAWPLFLYDPGGEGVFGSRIDLSANPDPAEPWTRETSGAPFTLAHWALAEGRFAHLFAPLTAEDPPAAPLSHYLDLPYAERARHTPLVERNAGAEETERLRVHPTLVAVCEARAQAWRMLQELAGLVTPFTARVERAAEERVAAARADELAAQAAAFEARLAGLRGILQEETRQLVRERLMQLAGYPRPTPAAPRAPAPPP